MKINYRRGSIVIILCYSCLVFSQQKISSEQIQPILDKLEMLGKEKPAAAFPLYKLSKSEYAIYSAYRSQKLLDEKNLTDHPLRSVEGNLKNSKTPANSIGILSDKTRPLNDRTIFNRKESAKYSLEAAFNKAFVKNSFDLYPVVFGTIPLTPPHTLTAISSLGGKLYADDLAGDGNLYALNDDSKYLVKVFSNGTTQNVGALTNLVAGETVSGLSWNRANNVMYATSVGNTTGTLYTVNLATGALTVIGTMTGISLPIWLEIDNAGLAFAADTNTDKLYAINLTNGAATEIGSLGINISFSQEADFNISNNTLYMSGYLDSQESNIYTVNTTTGAATVVGSTNGNEITMFTIADNLPVLAVENVNASKFSYYPNPTTGILNISAAGQIEKVNIFNMMGQKVLSVTPKTNPSEINMSSLPKGVYIVKAFVDGVLSTNKVIKK